jgi:rod shape-determining protein MreC
LRRTASPVRGLVVGGLMVVLSAFVLQFDRRTDQPGALGTAVAGVVSPLQTMIVASAESVRTVWQDYVALTEVRAENRLLQARIKQLQTQAAVSAELKAESSRLRQLLDLADRRKDLRLRAARVVARTVSPYFRVLRIDLEVGDGVIEPGMPVIAPGGVVGQIRTVDGSRAEVLLVTDPRSAIDVVLEQSRARGVAVGTGQADRYAAKLQYLQREVRAVEGERVLTTGDDGRYPRGLMVGEVDHAGEDDSGPFQNAEAIPVVDLNALDEVFVVLGPTGLSEDGERFEGGDKRGGSKSKNGQKKKGH